MLEFDFLTILIQRPGHPALGGRRPVDCHRHTLADTPPQAFSL